MILHLPSHLHCFLTAEPLPRRASHIHLCRRGLLQAILKDKHRPGLNQLESLKMHVQISTLLTFASLGASYVLPFAHSQPKSNQLWRRETEYEIVNVDGDDNGSDISSSSSSSSTSSPVPQTTLQTIFKTITQTTTQSTAETVTESCSVSSPATVTVTTTATSTSTQAAEGSSNSIGMSSIPVPSGSTQPLLSSSSIWSPSAASVPRSSGSVAPSSSSSSPSPSLLARASSSSGLAQADAIEKYYLTGVY